MNTLLEKVKHFFVSLVDSFDARPEIFMHVFHNYKPKWNLGIHYEFKYEIYANRDHSLFKVVITTSISNINRQISTESKILQGTISTVCPLWEINHFLHKYHQLWADEVNRCTIPVESDKCELNKLIIEVIDHDFM